LGSALARTGRGAGDITITKRQWGAFYGTPLDMQLRRRGTKTIVIAGIATNFGVESTARDAFERGYALVFVEDAMAGLSEGAHAFAISTIFPRLGRVRSTEDILNAIRA
jgi:nicotinamidase-related amidase